jgi:hypothetical protein
MGRDDVAYDLAAALQAARVPVRSINADFWPTNVTANEKCADFDALIVDGILLLAVNDPHRNLATVKG